MKTFLLLALLAAAPGLVCAQATTVKTKTKTPAGSTKAKITVPAAKPAEPTFTVDENKVEAKAAALTANMRQALNLTPAQVEKVNRINQLSVRNVEVARQRYRANLPQLNATISDIGQSRLSMLKDVLDPAQFAKYQRKREEKMGVPSQLQGATGNPAPGLPVRGEE
ncbi:hypothetical protein LJY25_08610 [Hymenobacter sp. BT175]|uniref:hypothetical protein n=1 Tax=Hymenobacter translucens TaxID=2886507 RepID=UPI001D0F294C|nr:hypothetical protein [Hymenobacter translucens]MCC2546502.1 hypothetical protein [Hymenobacter translucens]